MQPIQQKQLIKDGGMTIDAGLITHYQMVHWPSVTLMVFTLVVQIMIGVVIPIIIVHVLVA